MLRKFIAIVLQSIYFHKPRNCVLRGGRRLYLIVTLLPSGKSLKLCWEFFTHAPPENDHQLFLIVGWFVRCYARLRLRLQTRPSLWVELSVDARLYSVDILRGWRFRLYISLWFIHMTGSIFDIQQAPWIRLIGSISTMWMATIGPWPEVILPESILHNAQVRYSANIWHHCWDWLSTYNN